MTRARWEQLKDVLSGALEQSDAGERRTFLEARCAQDTSLRREVESLLADSAEELDDCAASVGAANLSASSSANEGRRLGSYELVRELGRGGMGTVWLARRADEHFDKLVAIKLLKRGTDTDEVLRRFHAERRILARLDHPNIARLFDAGTTDDGLPYFVMEHVEGARVTDYCFAQNLTVEARVKLFRKICGAVQFAHQNLIVHRDLKPANILITANGKPKLLDFGIAKLLARGEKTWQATVAGQERITPAYASPEQVRGQPVTTASDVYALGALLYELLTDQSPYRFSSSRPPMQEIMTLVCEQEPARPSQTAPLSHVQRQLRGDLDTIVLRAMSKTTERRYGSVGNFDADLRRYLEGKPVRARPDTVGYRTSKFIRRNKTASTAAFVVAATLLTSAVVTRYEATIARRERAQAERRFHELRRLANSFLFELDDAIETHPTEARKLLVQRAREYLDSLAGDARDDLSLRAELASAYQKLGDVESQLNQANIGDTSSALEDYRKALASRESLFAADPSLQQNTRARLDLARSYRRLADVQAKTGDTAAALVNYEKELPLLEIASSDSSDDERRVALASAYEIIGRTLFRTGDIAGAIAHYEKSLAEIDLSHVRKTPIRRLNLSRRKRSPVSVTCSPKPASHRRRWNITERIWPSFNGLPRPIRRTPRCAAA
ncbi:MAG: serine/threonine-protein kinase [Verrucomicrobiota bacterium]|nr:serine/threonine-protein kinase [Verrucomicrobiota bacterium]